MQFFFIFLIFFLQSVVAESNLTQEVESTLIHLDSSDKSEKKITVEKASLPTPNQIEREKLKREIKAKKIEEQKRLKEKSKRLEEERLEEEEQERQILAARLTSLLEEKKEIDQYLRKDNIWNRVYSNHETYQRLTRQLTELKKKITLLESRGSFSEIEKEELSNYVEEYQVLEGKLSQLIDYKTDPFEELVKSPKMGKAPMITNPIDIISALSFQKQIEGLQDEYKKRYKTLENAVKKLNRKSELLQEMVIKTRGKIYNKYVDELRATETKLSDFERTSKILKTTVNAFDKDVSQINFKIDEGIKHEVKKSIITGFIIIFLLLFFIFVKYLVKKYMSENELYYGTNKVINFIFILLVFIILLFTYLEDVENLVTVLSFASAGIAIALKDWFMSLMGWFVIIVSGSIHVGDRVKFVKDGVEYVGDIVDISIMRMTMHEDVTYTTVFKNRRSGRMIFIPNNYIFTDMIANYSHSGLKTVWDGIDFMVTFDSNIPKAQSIAKEVARKYSKGYTDMTRKQLNRLRSKYSMRNTAVEPRIFGFLDTYGVQISAWYLTNAYATLTLRSTISMEILAQIKEADDISLAYPSQSLYMDKSAKAKREEPTPEPPEKREESSRPTSKYKPDDWGLY